MIQSEHFGKEQSIMLIGVVWYHLANSTLQNPKIQKFYYVFTSSYLTHSSLIFQKCYNIFRNDLEKRLAFEIDEEIILSDGSAQQFKNRNNMYWCSLQSEQRGTYLK